MDAILSTLQKRLSSIPRNMILKLYKVRIERLRMLMHKGMPTDVCMLIEAKVRYEEYLPFLHLPGTGKSTYAMKRRSKRLGSNCRKCVRWTCSGRCRSIGMPSINRDDKIRFVKDGLSKENFENIQSSLETHPSGDVQIQILYLWWQFQNEWQRLGNLTIKDPVCQFLRKLDGKPILDS
ncbi:hypothetical protein GQ457_02G026900 [Hibiscus cannabinus]